MRGGTRWLGEDVPVLSRPGLGLAKLGLTYSV